MTSRKSSSSLAPKSTTMMVNAARSPRSRTDAQNPRKKRKASNQSINDVDDENDVVNDTDAQLAESRIAYAREMCDTMVTKAFQDASSIKEKAEKEAERIRSEAERDRQRWMREKEAISRTFHFDDVVKINTGDRVLTVRRRCLTEGIGKNSMLGAMFSGRHEPRQLEDGSFLLDTYGSSLPFLISYLTAPEAPIGELDDARRDLLAAAGDYYQMPKKFFEAIKSEYTFRKLGDDVEVLEYLASLDTILEPLEDVQQFDEGCDIEMVPLPHRSGFVLSVGVRRGHIFLLLEYCKVVVRAVKFINERKREDEWLYLACLVRKNNNLAYSLRAFGAATSDFFELTEATPPTSALAVNYSMGPVHGLPASVVKLDGCRRTPDENGVMKKREVQIVGLRGDVYIQRSVLK